VAWRGVADGLIFPSNLKTDMAFNGHTVKLTYFNIRGLAETIRYLLAIGSESIRACEFGFL
jgi:hypothetical protein